MDEWKYKRLSVEVIGINVGRLQLVSGENFSQIERQKVERFVAVRGWRGVFVRSASAVMEARGLACTALHCS